MNATKSIASCARLVRVDGCFFSKLHARNGFVYTVAVTSKKGVIEIGVSDDPAARMPLTDSMRLFFRPNSSFLAVRVRESKDSPANSLRWVTGTPTSPRTASPLAWGAVQFQLTHRRAIMANSQITSDCRVRLTFMGAAQ
jgi:hypothetical protein